MKITTILTLMVLVIFVFGCKAQQQQIPPNIINLCKTEGKIECNGGDCVDGFGERAYYDSTNQTFSEFGGDFYLSKKQKEASFAIHSSSVCECYNKFELKKNGEFEQVTCEEFFQTIEDKNKSCNGCVATIDTGCC